MRIGELTQLRKKHLIADKENIIVKIPDSIEYCIDNGGTMENVKNAYHNAASMQRIELVEMNAQFNVKHNLADYAEQQVFNSTGKIHPSPVTPQKKFGTIYSDYKGQPSYILANYDDGLSKIGSDATCKEGFVLVSRMVSGNQSCVVDGLAEKWISDGLPGIVVSGNTPQFV